MEFNLPKEEKEILKFWRKSQIFKKSLQRRKRRPAFVFYEGPPTANGKPGVHHVLARIFKDIICRYKTMRGLYVKRKAGWDTHGLPVELEIEKKIGVKSKKNIEKYGIGRFAQNCKKSVMRYKKEWEEMTERVGFWLDMENPYITYDPHYIETLFWIIKKFWDKGYLYEDFKVVPWCPRCQTSLSSHEVAQGYKRIKEKAVYIKFELKSGQKINDKKIKDKTYLLVWTTTPWTLPANVAVAVNSSFNYVKVRIGEENLILAKEKLKVLGENFQIISEFKGEDLVRLKYEPLFSFIKPNRESHYVVQDNFVSLEEGTGLVHIAPAFGEEDREVSKKNNLPTIITVNEEGRFKSQVKSWAGRFVKDADPLIIEDLKKRGLLLKEELYEHDYPFCWRCQTPLLYYLHSSWFIAVTRIKEELIKNNRKINWIPSFIKEGRFGKFLEEVQDWNFSRERYWGTPLPIWKCPSCNHIEVIGSLKDLRSKVFTTNRYFIMRHGFAETNLKGIVSHLPTKKYSLTKIGYFQVKRAVKKLKKILGDKKLDVIISSDLERCSQTAKIFAKEFNLEVQYDRRVREINHGEWEGKSLLKFRSKFQVPSKKFFTEGPKGGENWNDCKKRMINFIEDIDKKYQNKNVLIVSHGDPLWLLKGAMDGLQDNEFLNTMAGKKGRLTKGELREIKFRKIPYNKEGETDFHRPYIDRVKFLCPKCKGKMERVKEVCDVWFDSGAMPFAQYHWPFENKDLIDKDIQYPADYIAEAIDQTRGWFYTLLAVSTLLKGNSSYKNVICLGHVLDKKGKKMSKSKGNVVEPIDIMERYGADALRWYFFTINQPEQSKRFNEKDVRNCFNRFILTFWNSFLFWKEYSPNLQLTTYDSRPKNVLDRWVVSQLYILIKNVTSLLDNYDIVSAARKIENFVIEDLSRWYIRRSRPRFQRPKNSRELRQVSNILGFVLLEVSKLSAPFIPFISEKIYREIKKKGSVHLEDYPEVREKQINFKLEMKMGHVRDIISIGLQQRKEKNIKVRQPLKELKVESPPTLLNSSDKELLDLIKEELNVKEIKIKKSGRLSVSFDFKITPELKEEGIVREIIRFLQDMRKEGGLKKEEQVKIFYEGDRDLERVIKKSENFIKKITIAKAILKIKKPPYLLKREVIFESKRLWLAIKKI